jgi:hypothetical protein
LVAFSSAHLLRGHEPYFITILLQRLSKKMESSAGFYADQLLLAHEDWFNPSNQYHIICAQARKNLNGPVNEPRLTASKAVCPYPDNFLHDQSRERSKQFGIATCKADPPICHTMSPLWFRDPPIHPGIKPAAQISLAVA